MKRVALYVRVSTEEQKKHGLSVDSQIKALTDWAESNGHTIVNLYNDAGLSASVSYKKRKALLDMISDCQKGKIDLVVFTKLDRFFRSVPDYYACVEQMNNVPWKAIWEDYETETSAGTFKVNIMLSIAQAESERTGERIKAVNEFKRSQGLYVGTPPLGYKLVNKQLIIDEETREAVKDMFSVYLRTHSSEACLRALQKHGVARDMSNIRKLLRNPLYSGHTQGNDFPAYVTKAEQEQIISILDSGKTARATERPYLFNTMCQCGICGRKMKSKTVHHKQNGNDYISYSFVCESNGSSAAGKHYLHLSQLKLEKKLLNEIENIIGDYNLDLTIKTKNSSREASEKRIKALNEKAKRIGTRYEDGNISEDEYKRKIKEIKQELSTITLEDIAEPIKLPDNWKQIYLDLDTEHRHEFWMMIIKTIVINEDKSISIIFL